MKKTEGLTVRFTVEQLAAIDTLIESGDFGTRTEFIQFAVRKMLKGFEEGRSRAPPED